MSLPLSVLALAEASPFLARLTRSPALADFDWIQAQAQALTAADLGQRLDRLVASGAPLATALRRLRAQTLAHLIVRDASGAASLDEVVSAISALARLAVQRAEAETRQDLIARFGTPRSSDGAEQHLQVVAMGKLGGGELNASSDIDLIFVYPEDGDTDGSRSIGNQEFFIRQGRALIGQLAEVTADGMVFRVDMRLRPWGDAGPLAVSHAMLEDYLVAHGRTWERYAWMKALPLTGNATEALNLIVQPFVYRKYLDFSAFDALRDLHRQIRAEVTRRDLQDNIKLGPGGIREIEFIAQIFQLIRGGRDADLRERSTRGALQSLADRGRLPGDTAAMLLAAYDFLRRLEHALQYVDDAQTQQLPPQAEGRARVARLMRYTDWDSLAEDITLWRGRVSTVFETVFEDRNPPPEADDAALAQLWHRCADAGTCAEALAGRGFDPALAERLLAARQGSRYRTLSANAQARVDALVPLLARAAQTVERRDAALAALLDLIEAIGGRVAYLALLQEHPPALQRVAQLVSASTWLAQYLNQHPIVLDELLDPRSLAQPPDWPTLFARLRGELNQLTGDTEAAMDALRHFRHAQTFRLVAQGLTGLVSLEHLADGLSALADGVMQQVIDSVWADLRGRHREQPLVSVIGYGKLGGKELSFASDLDLVWVHDDASNEAGEVYSRLVQRCNSWLNRMTAAGVLYETDLRLRPDGDAGLLVCNLAHWRDYLHQRAWTWELQALTRARAVAGDADLGRRIEAVRREILALPRNADTTRDDIVAMRRRMLDAHRPQDGVFNLKQDRGGIIDTEFVVQYWILVHSHRHPELLDNLGTLALLERAAGLGLIDPALAAASRDAYREFRQQQHLLRLNAQGSSNVPAAGWEAQREAVQRLWDAVLGELPDAVEPLRGRAPST